MPLVCGAPAAGGGPLGAGITRGSLGAWLGRLGLGPAPLVLATGVLPVDRLAAGVLLVLVLTGVAIGVD